jgi:hypothetical protein
MHHLTTGESLKLKILKSIGLTERTSSPRRCVEKLNRTLMQHTLQGYAVAGGDDDDCERMLRYVYDLACTERRPAMVYYAVGYVVNTMIRAYPVPHGSRGPIYRQAFAVLCATHPIAQRI